MRVRLTSDRAGWGWEEHEGDLVELPEADARRLIESGQAEPAAEITEPAAETTEAPTPVQTSAPATKRSKR